MPKVPANRNPDATDIALLQELQENARLSLAELGRRVGLSSPAVADRLERLEEAGVIVGYRAEVDPRALGFELAVVLRIRPAPRELKKVAELAQRTPEIVECNRITGDVDHMEKVIDRFAIYGQTTTSIVQSSPVRRRALPLEA
jgi:Lrp/AsnC family leucine-responsive transcriptional regulator